jgi:hypothetical protein
VPSRYIVNIRLGLLITFNERLLAAALSVAQPVSKGDGSVTSVVDFHTQRPAKKREREQWDQ